MWRTVFVLVIIAIGVFFLRTKRVLCAAVLSLERVLPTGLLDVRPVHHVDAPVADCRDLCGHQDDRDGAPDPQINFRTLLIWLFFGQTVVGCFTSEYPLTSWLFFQDFTKVVLITYLMVVLVTDRSSSGWSC
jgi:hypothetical protein